MISQTNKPGPTFKDREAEVHVQKTAMGAMQVRGG